MKTMHLSDSDIQRFTFDLSKCDSEIIKHVHTCDVCKKRVESYQSISKSIQDQPTPVLEFNLTEMVLDHLPSSHEKPTAINYLIYSLIMACLGVVCFVLYSFKDALIDLFSYTSTIVNYFIMSVAILVLIDLGLDMYRSFNKKLDLLNYS